MNTYKLTHHYSRLCGSFAVKTDFNLHQLNLACAYIQLIRIDLPDVPGAEDGICEDDGEKILCKLYGMKGVDEPPYDAELDFYDNWNDYCGGRLDDLTFEIINIARPGAYRAVIESMIENCRDSLENHWVREGDDEKAYVDKIQSSIERLSMLLEGKPVDPAWGWRSPENLSLDGRVFIHQDGERDIPAFLMR